MCRMIQFSGGCMRCLESYIWDDLTQRLLCLEAKNNDAFGSCRTGVFVEKHDFDQECDRCAEEDEGVGDVGDEEAQRMLAGKKAKRAARHESDEEAKTKQKSDEDKKIKSKKRKT